LLRQIVYTFKKNQRKKNQNISKKKEKKKELRTKNFEMKICELFSSCKKSMGNEAQNQVNLKSQVHSHDSLVFAYLKKKVNNRKKSECIRRI